MVVQEYRATSTGKQISQSQRMSIHMFTRRTLASTTKVNRLDSERRVMWMFPRTIQTQLKLFYNTSQFQLVLILWVKLLHIGLETEFWIQPIAAPIVLMLSLLLVGECRMVKNFGGSEILGALVGVIRAMARLQLLRGLECVVFISTQRTLLFEWTQGSPYSLDHLT
jgi:hypothetical protein